MQFIHVLAQNRLAVIAVLIVMVLGGLSHHVALANARFSHAYLLYAVAADDADTAAYIPTATNNPIRFEINQTLAQILGTTMSDAERLAKAERGLDLAHVAKDQIDGISPTLESVDQSISAMEKELHLGDAIFQKGDPQKIIELAKKRQAAVKDIQALSYRANFETEKIFQHLIQSQGTLSGAYISDLNNEIPAAEDDFTRRQNRYNDLQSIMSQIHVAYDDFKSMTKETYGRSRGD